MRKRKNNTMAQLLAPFYSFLSLIIFLMMPFMLWDFLVGGFPLASEGGFGVKPLAPTSFELIAMASVWIANSFASSWELIRPVWDKSKGVLDEIGRLTTIAAIIAATRRAYKWIKKVSDSGKKRNNARERIKKETGA